MGLEGKPIFILGIGAQKAGTSWLHVQLNQLDMVDMGAMKEYHVWDIRFLQESFVNLRPHNDVYSETLRQMMRTEDGVYENYFLELIDNKIRITGDFTPSYAMLDSEHFQIIKDKLEAIGFNVKVVFFQRDPVSRIWSALGMAQRRRENSRNPMSDAKRLELFDSYYLRPEVIAKTRYDKTIRAIEKVFDKDNIYYGFYEDMFEMKSLERISTFLDLDLRQSNVTRKINASKKIELSAEQYQTCRAYYRQVYEFCEDAFPETKELWKHH